VVGGNFLAPSSSAVTASLWIESRPMASAHWRALVSSSPSLLFSPGVTALSCILERVSGAILSWALAGSFVVPLAGPRNTQGNRFNWHTGREKVIQAKKQSEAPTSLLCLVNSCLVTGRSIRNSLPAHHLVVVFACQCVLFFAGHCIRPAIDFPRLVNKGKVIHTQCVCPMDVPFRVRSQAKDS
jgi:hypothetical protein